MRIITLVSVALLLTSVFCALPAVPQEQKEIQAAPMAAIVKPDGYGPFPVGSITDTMTPSTKAYPTNLMVFYPAQANGSDTAADMTKAPYPTIIFLPFFGGNEQAMAGLAQKMASWGLVVMTVSVNWNDFPRSANISDMEDFLDYLETRNATSGQPLYQVIDKEAFGLSGYSSGGGLTIVDATYVDRIKAVQTLAAAIGAGSIDGLAPDFHKPILLQIGKDDSQYIAGSRAAYKKFDVQRSMIEIIGASHGGPFADYLFPAFYLYQFNRVPEYRTFLYGTEAVRECGKGLYDLYFNLSATEYFPPTVSAWANDSYVNMDEEVAFNGTIHGYYPNDDPQSVFQWEYYGDGNPNFSNTSVMNTTYSYTTAGTYTPVFRWRMGMFSVSATVQPSITVNNILPVADAGPDQTVNEDQVVKFDSYGSFDSPSDWMKYSWTFGDGSPATNFTDAMEVNHTFTRKGNYTVTLTVKDSYGAAATDKLKVNVANLAPTARITRMNQTGTEDSPMQFNGTGNDTASDRGSLICSWDFGDGTVTTWSTQTEAVHTYTRSGNYTVILTVKDNNDATGTDERWVVISNIAPIGVITSPEAGSEFDEETSVEFQGFGQDTESDMAGLTYRWEFGDGSSTQWSMNNAAAHVYNRSGTYTVKFFVKDEDEGQAIATAEIVIKNLAPVATIVAPQTGLQVMEDEMVSFTGTGTDTSMDVPGLHLVWTIDGEQYQGEVANHTFTKAGTYTIILNVTDSDGAYDAQEIQVKVTNKAPILTAANVEPLKIKYGGAINFSAQATDTASDMAILTYEWTFGDGAKATNASGSHVYSKNGTFTVQVTVRDDEGAEATKTFTVTVEQVIAPPPHNDDNEGLGMMAYAAIAVVIVIVIIVAAVLLLMRSKQTGMKEGKVKKVKEEEEE